jgi:putative hydrolase of HD superfamily
MNKTSPSPKPTIERLLELQKTLVRFSAIDRQVFLPPVAEVAESNVEHSYSLAMLAWFLAPQFPHLELGKLLQLCLAHDLLEVNSGDTFSFDDQAVVGQKDREAQAVAKLKEEWLDFPALLATIEEYESRKTAEAAFVTALDRLHPIIMDYLCEGRTWQKFGITFEKWLAVKGKEAPLSPEVAEYFYALRDIITQNRHLFSVSVK